MKRLWLIFLTALLLLNITSCSKILPSGDATTSKDSETAVETPWMNDGVVETWAYLTDEDGEDILESYQWKWGDGFKKIILEITYGDGFDWHKLTLEQKKTLRKAVADAGARVEFYDDGSASVIDDKNDKSMMQLGGTWPNNEYTSLLPVFSVGEMNIMLIQENKKKSDILGFSAAKVELESMREYVIELKRAGFDLSPKTTDMIEDEIQIFEYSAENERGDKLEIRLESGVAIASLEINASDETGE